MRTRGCGPRHGAVHQRARRRPQREVEPGIGDGRTAERQRWCAGPRHRPLDVGCRRRRRDDAERHRGEVVGPLLAGQDADALERLLADPPRRVVPERLKRHDRRRIFAARHQIGELDADDLVGIGPARPARSRRGSPSRRNGRRVQASCQRTDAVRSWSKSARDAFRQRAAAGRFGPTREGRRGATTHDRVGVTILQGEQGSGERGQRRASVRPGPARRHRRQRRERPRPCR